MKGKIIERNPILSLLLILTLVLSVSIVPSLVPATPVMAACDNVTITSPTGAAPKYVKSASDIDVTVGFTAWADNTTAGDIKIYVYYTGTTNQAASEQISSVPLPINGYNDLSYDVTIPAGTAEGDYDLQVGCRQPAGLGDYELSGIETGAVVVDNTPPDAPTLSSPTTGACTSDNRTTLDWSDVTETPAVTYKVEVDNNSDFSSPEYSRNGFTPSTDTTTALADGTYYWRVCATDNATNDSAWTSAWTYTVDILNPTNPTAPLPNDATLLGNYNPTLSWTAGADIGPSLLYWVEISPTDSFSTITESANVTITSYVPTSALDSQNTWYWRVRAVDCAGNVDPAGWLKGTTGQYFTKSTQVTSYDINLAAGWNLISLPLLPTTYPSPLPIADFLEGIQSPCTTANVTSVYYWDASNPTGGAGGDGWFTYITLAPSAATLTAVEPCKAYWINMPRPCTLRVTGTQTPVGTQVPLSCYLYTSGSGATAQYWNMLGFKSTQPLTPNTYLGNCSTPEVTMVCSYTGGWHTLDMTSDLMYPGLGYWVYTSTDCCFPAPLQ